MSKDVNKHPPPANFWIDCQCQRKEGGSALTLIRIGGYEPPTMTNALDWILNRTSMLVLCQHPFKASRALLWEAVKKNNNNMRMCDSSRLIMVALTSVCFNESDPAVLAFIMVRVQRHIYGFCFGKAARCFIASPPSWPPSELAAVLVMCTLSSSPSPLTPDITEREG